MYRKYTFPLQLFVILEKTKFKIWFNKSLEFNHYFLYFNKVWFITFFHILKHEVFLNHCFLVEHSAVDFTNYSKFSKNKWKLFFLKLQFFYNFYFYFLKTKILVMTAFVKKKKRLKPLYSIDRFFNNASWLERESSEMYGIFFFFKKDSRKLLLDYSKIEHPMLKNFSSEGLHEVFYNFFFHQVVSIKNEIVEL